MKKFIALIVLAASMTSQANTLETVFKKETSIPKELQEKIFESLKTRCSDIISAYGLREMKTEVRIDRVDQGITDRYYTTVFTSRYYFDGYHPTTTRIEVKSVEYSPQYDDNFSVLEVNGENGCN